MTNEEIDRKVAEAIGAVEEMGVWWLDGKDIGLADNCDGDFHYFRPSTDWNDAMLALEKSGALSFPESHNRCQIQFRMETDFDHPLWEVYADYGDDRFPDGRCHVNDVGEGPLAICQFILTYKGAQ